MSDIQETIDRLRELNQTASPAPWDITHSNSLETSDDGGKIIGDAEGGVIAEADVDLWSHSFFIDDALPLMVKLRNALPALLAEIDRLTTRLSIAEARLGRVAANHPEAYLAALQGDKE